MAADKSNTVSFFHGPTGSIQSKIDDGSITPSDFIVSSDENMLYYVDKEKRPVSLGNAKSSKEFEVNLGNGGTVGGLKTGDTIDAGTTLDELIQMLVQKRVPATYTQPTVACRVSGGTAAGAYEVGTEINTNIQGIFTKNDAGEVNNMKIYKDGSEVLSQGTSPITAEGQTFTLTDGSVVFKAEATYAEGPIKNDNLGSPSPDGHIMAGTKTSGNVTFTGQRKSFWGSGVGQLPEITSEFVRALKGNKLGPSQGNTFDINVAVGDQYIAFAYPATIRDVSKVEYVETTDGTMAQNFTKTTISVNGANGATGADYKVYTYSMAVPAAATMTMRVTL